MLMKEGLNKMDNDKNTDAFTCHILENIDASILDSFSSSQLLAIKDAIRSGQSGKKHPIDFRGVFNFFFVRYYFVILMGRDWRVSTQELEFERRRSVALFGNIIFLILVISPLILLVFFAIYLVKVGLGIDLFPGQHTAGIFGF